MSLPWAGETVPSDKVVPANLPSGVAPMMVPPANIDEIEAPPIPLIFPFTGRPEVMIFGFFVYQEAIEF